MKRMLRKLAAPTALAVGLGAGATAVSALRDPIPSLDAQLAPSAAAAAGPQALSSAFRGASRTALPGVVYVQVEAAPRAVSRQANPFSGTPFEDFFGPGGPQGQVQPMPRMGSGSGFIISSDGYVLTNNHVVEDANRVTVTLTDKREYTAKVVGRDPNTDVAVLKLDAKGLPTVQLGDADDLQVGDWVLALGYPMSLGETVTAGIVSAKGKSIGIMRQNRDAAAPLEHFIQTDAAINPGNSGGPLVDLDGRVVGINSAIASPTGTYSGYGFAVPINLAKRVADDLIRYGSVRRPKLGVQIKDVEPADVEVFGLKDARGSVVASVPEGPAKDAGIELGDVIVALDGAPIMDTGDLMEKVARRQPGEKVTLDMMRYGSTKRVAVKLGSFDAERPTRTAAVESKENATSRLGFEAATLTPALVQQLRSKLTEGVIVTRVDRMGPASPALAGMVLERINGTPISSTADLQKVASSLKPGSAVSIIGRTQDGARTIVNYRLRD